jgi:hypothetical protein
MRDELEQVTKELAKHQKDLLGIATRWNSAASRDQR